MATIIEALPSQRLQGYFLPEVISPFIPRWTFFAPNPGIHDYHLLYRYQFQGGAVGLWRQVAQLTRRRTKYAVLWNPEKRVNKVLTDLATTLVSYANIREENALIQVSIPYILIINYVSNLPRPWGSIKIQFLLMRRQAIAGSEEVIFVSSLHSIL